MILLNELRLELSRPENITQIFWDNGYVFYNIRDYFDTDKIKDKGLNNICFLYDIENKTITQRSYDDWSDIKYINRIQSALKDFIRLNLINKNWKCIIGTEINTKKVFSKGTVDNILKYDSSFSNIIPICFHGTSDYYLDDIKKYGLLPTKYAKNLYNNFDYGYTKISEENIYLTIDYDRAKSYANNTVNSLKKYKIKSTPIIIQILNLPITNVMSDDDFKNNMNKVQLLQFIKTGKRADINNFIQSIRNTGQFAFNGRIPYNKLKIIK